MDLKFVILLLCCLASAHSQQCHVQGEVVGAINGVHDVTSYNECLNYCQANADCSCFTYYEDRRECQEFSEYNSLDISCSTCISGEPACPEYHNCNIDGLCIGTPVDEVIVDSEAACLSQCKANADCAYYAYQGTDDTCFLLADCSDVFPCTDCHSGERACSISSEGKLKCLGFIV